MSINQYTAKKLLANIITINKKLLDMTLGLAEAFKGNTVGFIIGEVDSDVTEPTNRVKQPVCVVEVTDAVAELRAEVEWLTAERDALQSQLDDLSDNRNQRRNEKVRNQRKELDALGKAYRSVLAERDALQARIDAGVRVWGNRVEGPFSPMQFDSDTHTAILIDRQPIADHIVDANKMVDDDRKGEADRKPQWTRADGSTTPRTGERRKSAPPWVAAGGFSMSEQDIWRNNRRVAGSERRKV